MSDVWKKFLAKEKFCSINGKSNGCFHCWNVAFSTLIHPAGYILSGCEAIIGMSMQAIRV
jgi:hypothetical protein